MKTIDYLTVLDPEFKIKALNDANWSHFGVNIVNLEHILTNDRAQLECFCQIWMSNCINVVSRKGHWEFDEVVGFHPGKFYY